MPRNGSGTFTLVSGNPVVTGTTIESNWANTTLSDIATTLTDSLSRSGQGGMTAALRIADGTQGAPGVGFANETGSGLYRAGTAEVWAVVQGAQTMKIDSTGVTVPAAKATSIEGTFVFNETGADKDARFEGDTDVNLLFTDASTDRVGIGTNTPSTKLDVVGDVTVSGAVNAGSVNATTLDLTNIEVTNIKAKDGTASMTLADATGVASFSANPILNAGTANGVAYANASKVLTTGSALTFDGTKLGNVGTAGGVRFEVASTTGSPEVSITSADTGTSQINFGGATTPKKGRMVYSDNSDLFYWSLNNGSEQMRLTSTGLGIGTSSPGAKLGIDASGTSGYWERFYSSGTELGYWYFDANTLQLSSKSATRALTFLTNDTERMRLDSSGNLGLGVTPSAWSTGRAFEFGAVGNALWGYSGNTILSQNTAGYSGSFLYATTAAASRYQQNAGSHAWYTAPSGTAGNAISFTQAMTLDADGRLGIGITNPAYRLDVEISSGPYSARFNNSNSSTNQYNVVLFGQAAAGSAIGYIGTGGSAVGNAAFANNFVVGTQTSNALVFNTADTERARITSGGDLLVPSAGSGSTGRISVRKDTGVPLAVSNEGVTGTLIEFSGNGSGALGSITHNGTNVAYNTSSDYRLKDNPQPLTNSGAFIDALQPKTWNWKTDGARGVGFIAHEAQAVSPTSVVGEKDAVDADGKPVMQAMEYGSAEFIANIIAELQSLRARVAALEAQP